MWRVGVVGKDYINTENSQMASIGVIFSSTYHAKELNPWPNSPASHVVIYSWLSACPWEMEPFYLWMSSKPQKQATTKAVWLVNVYSYHVMVKSVCCYCVHENRLFSNQSHMQLSKSNYIVTTKSRYCIVWMFGEENFDEFGKSLVSFMWPKLYLEMLTLISKSF